MSRKTKLRLYQGARDCINQLRCSNPSKHIAENDLAICVIFITRRHLRETALEIIDIIEKDNCLFNNLQYLQSINVMISNCSRIFLKI